VRVQECDGSFNTRIFNIGPGLYKMCVMNVWPYGPNPYIISGGNIISTGMSAVTDTTNPCTTDFDCP
jgi:hypothetical protein